MANQNGNNEIVSLGLRLLLITAVAGFILGLGNKITAEPIAKQLKLENDTAMKEVLPIADEFNKKDIELKDGSIITEVNEGKSSGEVKGYAIKVAPSGYGGEIDLMVGISNEGKVEGIKVLSHSETPGLGANSTKPEFQDQFKGKPIDKELEVVKGTASGDNQIQALTGATITSRAVTKGVNEAINFYNEELKGGQN